MILRMQAFNFSHYFQVLLKMKIVVQWPYFQNHTKMKIA